MRKEEQQKIIEIFRKNLLRDITIQELMRELKKKSYNWMYLSLKKMEKEELIRTKKIGNTITCKYNLKNPKAITELVYSEESREYPQIIHKIIQNITKITPFFVLLIGGSYAERKPTSKSDLDLAVVIENGKKKQIQVRIKDASRLSEIEIDDYVFTKKEFLGMLKQEGENFGKQLVKKHIIPYGADAYYSLLKEVYGNVLQI